MYRWYEKSGVCYAYLRDVPSVPLDQSRWFTRGWTLQELLAPKSLFQTLSICQMLIISVKALNSMT